MATIYEVCYKNGIEHHGKIPDLLDAATTSMLEDVYECFLSREDAEKRYEELTLGNTERICTWLGNYYLSEMKALSVCKIDDEDLERLSENGESLEEIFANYGDYYEIQKVEFSKIKEE